MASVADQRIKVGIRVRKLTRKEKERNKQLHWKYSDNQVWQIDPQNGKKMGNTYSFDYVFGMDSSSQNIFDDLVKPIVESSVKGFNGTIFAYGQTSSGKTYTMIGEKSEEGIIPLSVNHVFNTADKDSDREYLLRVSYMEIYNEKIHDLLECQNNLKIHEDSSGNAFVMLKEEIVDCPEKVMAVMKKGEKMRRFGVTDINERSSRSHTIFRITIESRRHHNDLSSSDSFLDDAVHVSHLNLIDLAGSERVFQTKATGERFKEGCAINKSLFHLGNVISQLSEGTGQFVNFRDSKLTRILESSLGGNAHTAIICTVTPASVEETASTLCFASRAIRVTNAPQLNEIVSDECLIRRHAALVKKLEMELEKAKQDNDTESMKKELEQKEKIICRLKDWIKRDELQVYSPRVVSRSDRRKTWAASDLAASLLRAKALQQEDLNALNEEDFGSGSISVDSPTLDNVLEIEKSDFVRRDRGSSGLWNKENHPLHVRLSWQSPMFKSGGKEPKRVSQGGGKKRKSAMGDIPFAEDMSLHLLERDQRIRCLESKVEELKLKLDGAVKDKETGCNEQLCEVEKDPMVVIRELCGDVPCKTNEDTNNPLQNNEAALKLKVESLEASLENEKSKVAALEMSLENEERKLESLESCMEKQAQEIKDMALKEKELLLKMEESERDALSDKRVLMSVIESMLDEELEKNVHEVDMLSKIKHFKESTNSLERRLKENDSIIHSLNLEKDELYSALNLEKLQTNEANAQLKDILENINNISREIGIFTRKSNHMQGLVNEDAATVEGKDNALCPKSALNNLTEVIEELKSFFTQEISGIIKQAEGFSVMTVKMEEEISDMKMQFGKLLKESYELKAERNEFQSHLNNEKDTIDILQAQLQSSEENRLTLSNQVNGLIEQLKKTERDLLGMTESRKEAELDLLENASRINELEEELQASEVVIANLAESDEDNLVDLQELTRQRDKLKEELIGANENMKSLLAEIKNMRENSASLENLDSLKSEILGLTSLCESYQVQLNEIKEACVGLEEKNTQLVEEMTIVIEERDRIIAESEEVRSANSRGFSELMVAQEALKEAKSELSNLTEENELLTLSLTTEKNKFVAIQSTLEEITQEKDLLLKELEGLRQTCNMENNQLEVLTSLHKELEQVKFSLTVCTESEKELDNLLTLEKEKIISLNYQLALTSSEKEEIMLKCEQLQQSVDQLENMLTLSKEEKTELANNVSQLTTLNAELTTKMNEIITNFSNQEQGHITNKNELKSKIEEMETELGKRDSEIDLLNLKNSELSHLLELKGEKMSELESKISDLNVMLSLNVSEINAGKDRISELEDDLIAAQERLNTETAHVREKCEELMKEKLEEMSLTLQETEEKLKINAEEADVQRDHQEGVISNLSKQLENTEAEFELISRQKDSKIQSLEHEIQLEVEKLILKSQETDSLLALKADVEAKLEEVSAEKEKLCLELELAEKKIENLRNDTDAKLEVEKNSYEQNISSLQKQLQDANEEFEMILKEKDEKLSSLQHELQLEAEKFRQKSQEIESLQSMKSDAEAKLNEILAEKEKLSSELELAEKKIENLRNDTAAELVVEKNSYEQNISSLQKQLQDANEGFEMILKDKDEKLSSLQYELQLEVEKFHQKSQEMESLQSMKNDAEAKLNEILAVKEKLCSELEIAEKKIENLRSEFAAELGVEKNSYEQNISSLQKQLQDANEEFEMILKEKDEKLSSLQHELQLEAEKFCQKSQEIESLQSMKSDAEAKLNEILAEKEKLSSELELAEKKIENLRNDTAAELVVEKNSYEQNISSLQKQLQDANEEFEMILKDKDEKLSSLQYELQLEVEKFHQKSQEMESLQSMKNDAEAKLNEILAVKEKLCSELEMAEKKIENLRSEFAAELGVEKNSYEQNISSLQKQLQDANEEFEMILKEKDGKVSSLQHELQLEVEKLNQKNKEIESLQLMKGDAEAKLSEVLAEKENLCIALGLAEEKIENLRNDIASELEFEKNSYEQNISSLQKQLQDANEEFEMILKVKDEEVSSLKHKLQFELENFAQKNKEMESLQLMKNDSEAKLTEVLAEKEKYCKKLELAEEKIENLKKDTEAELGIVKSNYEQTINSLQKQLQDVNEEFEIILKVKDEEVSALQHKLQLEIEKFNLMSQETESLVSMKNEIEVKLVEVSSEKKQLTLELEVAEEKIQKLKNDIETERSVYEKNTASLQEKLIDAKEELKLILKQKDEKIRSLEDDISSEVQKFNEKEKECMHVQFLKKELEMQIEHFALEEQKYLATEKKLLAEEMKTESLEKRLEELNANYIANFEEFNRLKCLEHGLQSDLEKLKKHNSELENAHDLTKKDLSTAQSNNEKLQSEISGLKDKLQEETNTKQQLNVLLNIEQEGRLAARAAEEKTLELLASQQKIISVFETTLSDLKEKLKSESEHCNELNSKCNCLESKLADTESSTHAMLSCLRQEKEMLEEEVKGLRVANQQKPNEEILIILKEKDQQCKVLEQKMKDALNERSHLETELSRSREECKAMETHLSQIQGQLNVLQDTINKKQEELNELKEKYNEKDDYAKRMDQWVVKMEKRVTTADDYRIEIQQKAKAMETELKLKINQLKTEKERLERLKMNPEPVKCNCPQYEKDLKREKEEKEALRLKVDEFNRFIASGGRSDSAHSKKLEVSHSAVQTTSVEVVDIDPSGCGVVQVCKVDVLNQLVNKLRKDKEDLKQICRRRHNQREELKLQVEELKIKLQTLESQARKN